LCRRTNPPVALKKLINIFSNSSSNNNSLGTKTHCFTISKPLLKTIVRCTRLTRQTRVRLRVRVSRIILKTIGMGKNSQHGTSTLENSSVLSTPRKKLFSKSLSSEKSYSKVLTFTRNFSTISIPCSTKVPRRRKPAKPRSRSIHLYWKDRFRRRRLL